MQNCKYLYEASAIWRICLSKVGGLPQLKVSGILFELARSYTQHRNSRYVLASLDR